MRSGLSSRIPLRGTRDEWDHLAENLNSMLDRIEELMEGIRQVSDNIAHDLRTPLSRVRGRLERASDAPLDADQSRQLISDTIGEIDRILALFSSILHIAQLEAHEGASAFQTVDLAEIAGQVAELFDAAAEEKGGHVTLVGARFLPVVGDRDLLFDALANLVDNAIKYGGGDGRVAIEIRREADGAIVVVSDRGPGIPRGGAKERAEAVLPAGAQPHAPPATASASVSSPRSPICMAPRSKCRPTSRACASNCASRRQASRTMPRRRRRGRSGNRTRDRAPLVESTVRLGRRYFAACSGTLGSTSRKCHPSGPRR